MIQFCYSLRNLTISHNDSEITLINLSGFPCIVNYSVQITNEFSVSCYKGNTSVPVREYLGFVVKIERYSQLNSIISKLEDFEVDLPSKLKNMGEQLSLLASNDEMDDEQKIQLQFLAEQLQLQSQSANNRRYSAFTVNIAISAYLRSRNCYAAFRDTLALPHPKTIKNYFGKLGTPGSLEECSKVIATVFNKLEGSQIFCKILFDEIHIKPSIRYRGGHVIGFSVDQEDKPAKTVLALMVDPLMGGPAFVARLVPIYSLKSDLLFDQINILLKLIHENNGFVYLAMSDNLSTNRKCTKLFHQEFGTTSIASIPHPIPNIHFTDLFLYSDPVHLFRNVRNNWITEKLKKLRYVDPESSKLCVASWSDLISIYKEESQSYVKQTKLSYAALYPSSFEKQKTSLAQDVFNEKTVAALKLKGFEETARFIDLITKLWNILNIKSPHKGRRLQDPLREPFTSPDDTRFVFLESIKTMLGNMNTALTPNSHRIMCLTEETSQGWVITITGLIQTINVLLEKNFSYVLAGEFQSDPIEGEFGTFRQLAGGNYNISHAEILNGLSLRRLKLFQLLDVEQSFEHSLSLCCSVGLSEEELEIVDDCISDPDKLTEVENSTLFYIAGYVSFKESIKSDAPTTEITEFSEFTEMVSRGKLSYPPSNLVALSKCIYSCYKIFDKSCSVKLLAAFKIIFDYMEMDFDNIPGLLRRFVNTFSKAFVKHETNKIVDDKKKGKKASQVKKTRLSGGQAI